ncbi:AAA family ATPase [Bradyrhizobium ottawaense]|nr:AAA family ATPase [Bradyrhizobium ottawaense]
MKHRIRQIDLQGFRGFGASLQSFTLPESVVALWGGNSQGKTSLAEAIEFLLTGHIARRELLASAKDEFSRALRNAHIPDSVAVFVEAHFVCPDGVCRRLRRTLTTDYDGSTDCVSKLEIDGAGCSESDVEARLGLRLLHPPLRAPVLAQHTLSYVFTASPTERAAYFRAVLDTQDLEDFRASVSMLPAELPAPSCAGIKHLSALGNIAELATVLKAIRNAKTKQTIERALATAIQTILDSIGVTAKASFIERIEQLDAELTGRRAQAFPIELFSRKPLAPWTDPIGGLADALTIYRREKAAISSESQRLVALFESALAIPTIHACSEPTDCPLCGTASTLTPERVAFLKEQLTANEAYQAAEKAALEALRATNAQLLTLSTAALAALPRFTTVTAADRRTRGFTVRRAEALSGHAEGSRRWAAASRALWRTTKRYCDHIAALRVGIEAAINGIAAWDTDTDLLNGVADAADRFAQLETATASYTAAVDTISGAIMAAVDQSVQTTGWEELIALARDPAAALQALNKLREHQQTVKALEKALREIDVAIGKVADEKFSDLSVQVLAWWERLRPGEPTFFSGVQRRGTKTRRTVDVKVALSAKEDRSDIKLRDAVAVFSQSQLHCLGLSLFLARAIDGGAGFVVLDDPVLTSDDDFRPNFASSVIEALLDAGVQVVVITQDHKSWKDIGHRWEHRGAAQFQIVRENPVAGSEIRGQGDALATMLAQARPFINSQDSEQRKEGATRLRRIIERFCKELIVKSRHANGDAMASITDYDGKAYGDFSAQALALLTLDPSHRGKLNAAYGYVTPGPHDDTPPSTAQLKVAAGDLNRLKKDYLP